MKWVIIFAMPIFFSKANASPVIVDDVHGQRVTIYVPPGTEVKPGDKLFTEKSCEANTQKKTEDPYCRDDEELLPSQPLRKRVHHITYSFSTPHVNLSIGSPVNTDLSSTGVSASLTYGYGFGYFEPWGLIQNTSASGGSGASENALLIGAGIKLNVIKDIPGNDWVPYIRLGVGNFGETYSASSQSIDVSGMVYGGSVGIQWYPFGEIFAVDLAYQLFTGSLGVSGQSVSTSTNLSMNGFVLGSTLAF